MKPRNFINLRGQVFGKWRVLYRCSPPRRGIDWAYWRCACVCGGQGDVDGKSLRRGDSTCCSACAIDKLKANRKARAA